MLFQGRVYSMYISQNQFISYVFRNNLHTFNAAFGLYWSRILRLTV